MIPPKICELLLIGINSIDEARLLQYEHLRKIYQKSSALAVFLHACPEISKALDRINGRTGKTLHLLPAMPMVPTSEKRNIERLLDRMDDEREAGIEQ